MLSPYTHILVVRVVFKGAGMVKTAEEELEAAGAVLALALAGSGVCMRGVCMRGVCISGVCIRGVCIRGVCMWHMMGATGIDADITFEAASHTNGLLVNLSTLEHN